MTNYIDSVERGKRQIKLKQEQTMTKITKGK